MWELEAIAKANAKDENRKRVNQEELEAIDKRIRLMVDNGNFSKEDVSSLVETLEQL